MSLRKSLLSLFGCCLFLAFTVYCLVEPLNWFGEMKSSLKFAISNLYTWIPGMFALYFMKKEGVRFKILSKPSISMLEALYIPILITIIGGFLTLSFEKFSLERVIISAEVFGMELHSNIWLAASVIGIVLLMCILASLSINFLFALGEELFWRGYLWEKLRCLGFWKACFSVACLSSIWMAPNIVFFGYLFAENPFYGVILATFLNFAMTPILFYFREKEEGVMSSTIFRAMMNSFCPFVVVFFPDSNPLYAAPLGWAGIGAMCLVLVIFIKVKMNEQVLDLVKRKAP